MNEPPCPTPHTSGTTPFVDTFEYRKIPNLDARKILKYLRSVMHKHEGLTLKGIRDLVFSRHITSARLHEAVELLERLDLIDYEIDWEDEGKPGPRVPLYYSLTDEELADFRECSKDFPNNIRRSMGPEGESSARLQERINAWREKMLYGVGTTATCPREDTDAADDSSTLRDRLAGVGERLECLNDGLQGNPDQGCDETEGNDPDNS